MCIHFIETAGGVYWLQSVMGPPVCTFLRKPNPDSVVFC